jgi:hypothetical protein
MGGLGSGKHCHYDAKSTVNNYHSIDVRKWHRQNLLIPEISFITKWFRNKEITRSIHVLASEKSLKLSYRYKHSDEWKDMNYSIALEWTFCNFGSRRPWFLCPVRNCRRRVAILYGGVVFACRYCCQLAYPSQRENIDNRTTRKAEKIRDRMGWEPGILNGEGLKPKGMHWKTYRRLCFLHNQLVYSSLREATLRFGINMFDYL